MVITEPVIKVLEKFFARQQVFRILIGGDHDARLGTLGYPVEGLLSSLCFEQEDLDLYDNGKNRVKFVVD